MGSSNAHSRFAPSASSRWMVCPGSVALSEKVPDQPDSEYAAEGTAAHELGAKGLLEQKNALDYLGQKFNGYDVTTEMAEAVQVYLDAVRARVPATYPFVKTLHYLFFVEKRFDLSWLHPGMFGSTDAYIYNPEKKLLHVIDYKHGVGVEVSPEWNSQAMIYALGAIHALWSSQTEITKKTISALQLVDTVEIVIVQPRIYGVEEKIKVWNISAADLIFWGVHVLKAAAAAAGQENAIRRVGKHCRFCPALPICPEHAQTALALAQTQFTDPVLPGPEQLTPVQVLKVLDLAKVFGAWADSVTAYAQAQMELGVQYPGWKLVKKKSNRKWVSEAEAETALVQALGDSAYKKELLSVAQAEDALRKIIGAGKAELDAFMQRYAVKPDNGNTIAPASDKRTAVAPSAVYAFLEDAEFLK